MNPAGLGNDFSIVVQKAVPVAQHLNIFLKAPPFGKESIPCLEAALDLESSIAKGSYAQLRSGCFHLDQASRDHSIDSA